MKTIFPPAVFLLVMTTVLAACAADATDVSELVETPTRIEDSPQPVTQYVAKADDFDCMIEPAEDPQKSWHKVRNFYLKNMTGRTQEALDVANGLQPAPYPVGTIIQLIYFEAMVKRGGEFSEQTSDWEFFAMDVTDGVTWISARGATDVTNFAGGNCFDCHNKAEKKYDLVCETGHGCDPLGVPPAFIEQGQKGDPRC